MKPNLRQAASGSGHASWHSAQMVGARKWPTYPETKVVSVGKIVDLQASMCQSSAMGGPKGLTACSTTKQ